MQILTPHPRVSLPAEPRCVGARYIVPEPLAPESSQAPQWPAGDRLVAKCCGPPPCESVPNTAARPATDADSALQSQRTQPQSRTRPSRLPVQMLCTPKLLSSSSMLLLAVDSKKSASPSSERLARCCRTVLPGDDDLRVRIVRTLHNHPTELHNHQL